ncbi:MAG: hypothetical protein JKY34_01870 [Kordiimonadaceae bacterium]|nr:hypothetical protein [Kordiimonadaceae bacterium]
MVDFNPKATALPAQLQAQVQGNRGTQAAGQSSVNARPRPQDIVDDRVNNRLAQETQNRRQLVKRDSRVDNLSSAQELEVARTRIEAVAGNSNNREAPVGRISARQTALRNQPLGQIVDIRV